MTFVRKTLVRGPIVYEGQGLFSKIRKGFNKVTKGISKALKSPVGKALKRVYDKTLAPTAKAALTATVGAPAADMLEKVGKKTLVDGKSVDSAVVSSVKEGMPLGALTGGGRFNSSIVGNGQMDRFFGFGGPRTSDIIRATKVRPSVVRRVTPAVVINRLEGGGGPIEADTTI